MPNVPTKDGTQSKVRQAKSPEAKAWLFKTNDVIINVSLTFRTLISEIYQYFCEKKCEKLLLKAFLIFTTKTSVILPFIVHLGL